MTKSTMFKWAVAAMLAVPAVPMFAKPAVTPAAKHTSVHNKTRKSLISTAKKHRHFHHRTKKHTTLSTSARAGRHVTMSAKRSAHPAAAHPPVRIATPPMIDGMHT